MNFSLMVAGAALCLAAATAPAGAAGQTRTYYIAADEVEWNYAPSGRNLITGNPLRAVAADRVGTTYSKAVYNAYTDGTFAQRIPKPAYMGILGPTIRAEVGDTIVVHFRNNTSFPQSMHPHGVFYEKASEGAPYSDGVSASAKGGASVPPHGSFRYVWGVPARAGPAAMDGSSVLWMYHSHVDESSDISAGLIGPMIVARKGMARTDGSPKDVDQEVVLLFALEDENISTYMPRNFKRINDSSALTPEMQHNFSTQYYTSNEMPSINGYIFGNMPDPVVRVGHRTRWYLIGNASDGLDYHAIHWHGNVATVGGMRTDMVPLLPGGMAVADMVPDNPGEWLFHCHVSFHLDGGMVSRYRVIK